MKQSRLRKRRIQSWTNTLSKINEDKCPILYKAIKEIVSNDD